MLTAPDLFEDLGHGLATDYFFLREQLTDEQLDALRRARVFVDEEVLPVIGGYWERAEMPWSLIRRLGRAGPRRRRHRGLRLPGMSPWPPGWCTWSSPRRRQPRHLLRRAGRPGHAVDRDVRLGGAKAALAAGHGPGRGARRVRADRARPRLGLGRPGDDRPARRGQWVLTGEALDRQRIRRRRRRRVGPGRGRAGQGYLVEKGTPGYDANVIEGKASLRAVWQADITLDDVRVPVENRLPGASSFKDTGRVLADNPQPVRLGGARARHRRLRCGADLRQAARPVRPAARELPDRPGAAGEDAGRAHRHAAVLPADRPPGRDAAG